MRESVGELELVHAPGFAQLDISPAQVFVHRARGGDKEDSKARDESEEIGDLMLGRCFSNPSYGNGRMLRRPFLPAAGML